MRPSPPAAMQAAAAQARAPLTATLAVYPGREAPGSTNTSNRFMQTAARRANTQASRASSLRDYLATV